MERFVRRQGALFVAEGCGLEVYGDSEADALFRLDSQIRVDLGDRPEHCGKAMRKNGKGRWRCACGKTFREHAKKLGTEPEGEVAMTSTERSRRSREKAKLNKTIEANLMEPLQDGHDFGELEDEPDIPDVPPHEILQHLMEENRLRQVDLVGVIGSSGVVSEVVRGKRAISKAQAKALGKFFGLSPAAFL